MTGKIVVYGAGGLGANIAAKCLHLPTNANTGEVVPHIIDTSRSNITEGFPEDQVHIFKNMDGSGKHRPENAPEIVQALPALLLNHQPGDLNIVVMSASGGSGSVIGPLLVKELLQGNHSVVCFVVGSAECTTTANNCVGTIKSLAHVVEVTDQPVVMQYFENTAATSRDDVDAQILYGIMALSILGSRNNRELDTRDLYNWLRFNRNTRIPAQLAILEIINTKDDATHISDPISRASLYSSTSYPPISLMAEYSCTGYFPMPLMFQSETIDELHFIVTGDSLEDIVSHVGTTSTKLKSRAAVRVAPVKVVLASEVDSVTGLVY